ncbi:Major facilitator super domain-containing protein 7 [Phlyctochytrium planicorne]|nr:Major facilitator super domain-containing protein 7 [Phlyctochytrium planicorne]
MPSSSSSPAAEVTVESPTGSSKKGGAGEHTLYRFRFYVGFVVFFANLCNAAVWATYSAVTPTTAIYYNCSAWQINQLSVFFQALFIVFIFPGTWVLDVYGLKPAILAGSWMTAVGALVRYLGTFAAEDKRLAIMTVGQMVAAIGQPFLLQVSTKAAALWFGEKERLTANTVMAIGQPLGAALILGIGPAIVNSDPSAIPLLNLVVFGISLICAIMSIFIRNRPLTAPSKSAEGANLPFLDGVKVLASNRWFWVIFGVFGLLIGAFNVYITLISDYVTPQGYSENDAGLLGLVTIVVGIVSAGIVGPILDRTQSHRTVFRVLPACCFLGVVLFFFGAGFPDRLPLLYVSSVLIGLGGFPVLALSLELGVECTYPVAEGTSSGLLWTGVQAWGIIGLIISNACRNVDGTMRSALGVTLAMVGISMLIAPFYNAISRRMAIEAGKHVEEDVDMATRRRSGAGEVEEGQVAAVTVSEK